MQKVSSQRKTWKAVAAAIGLIVVFASLFLLTHGTGREAKLARYIDAHYIRLPKSLFDDSGGWTIQRTHYASRTDIRYNGYDGGFPWEVEVVHDDAVARYPWVRTVSPSGITVRVGGILDIKSQDRAMQNLELMLPADKTECHKRSAWRVEGVPTNQRWVFHSRRLRATYVVDSDDIAVYPDKGAHLPDF